MIVELPVAYRVAATLRGSRTKLIFARSTLGSARTQFFELPELTLSEAPVVVKWRRLLWREIDGRLFRPVLTPRGDVAELADVGKGAVSQLLGVAMGATTNVWSDHPMFRDVSFEPDGHYRHPQFETQEGLRSLESATVIQDLDFDEAVRHAQRAASECLVIDGVLHKVAPAPGIGVVTDNGDISSFAWIAPFPGPAGTSFYFSQPHLATAFAKSHSRTTLDLALDIKWERSRGEDSENLAQATLRSVCWGLRQALGTERLAKLPAALSACYGVGVTALQHRRRAKDALSFIARADIPDGFGACTRLKSLLGTWMELQEWLHPDDEAALADL